MIAAARGMEAELVCRAAVTGAAWEMEVGEGEPYGEDAGSGGGCGGGGGSGGGLDAWVVVSACWVRHTITGM